MPIEPNSGDAFERSSNDGGYRAFKACHRTRGRRSRSRRNAHFSACDYHLVERYLALDWSPEQVSAHLRFSGLLSITHETIYLRIWADKRAGGDLWRHLRQATKKRRKRNGSHDSRGRLAGKRHISERPPEVVLTDLTRPRIHVQRSVQDGREIVGPPKSGKSRWVGIPPHIADMLQKRKELYCASEEDLVFPSHAGGRFDPSNLRSRVFYPALEKLGWREPTPKKQRAKKGQGARKGRGYCPRREERQQSYRLHDLRHSFAYIFLNRGHGDIYALKETMGHANISTTMNYTHFAEDDAVRASDTMAAAWNSMSETAKGEDHPAEDTAHEATVANLTSARRRR